MMTLIIQAASTEFGNQVSCLHDFATSHIHSQSFCVKLALILGKFVPSRRERILYTTSGVKFLNQFPDGKLQ